MCKTDTLGHQAWGCDLGREYFERVVRIECPDGRIIDVGLGSIADRRAGPIEAPLHDLIGILRPEHGVEYRFLLFTGLEVRHAFVTRPWIAL